MEHEIKIKGARVHNLKNIDVCLPHNKLIVITGLSGSGKSTLAFDTIFAEGQRRYVESLSAYARQFLGKIDKPDVDYITGIAPAIAVEQKVNTRNPRSTVGTSTEIYDYMRLLFARVGKTFSPISGVEVVAHSVDDVVEFILGQEEGKRLLICSPIELAEGQGVIEKLTLLLKDGFRRLLVDGEIVEVEDFLKGDTTRQWLVIVDRIQLAQRDDKDQLARLMDSCGRAFSLGNGACRIKVMGEEGEHFFSSKFEADGIVFDRPNDHMFSFNNPIGACAKCEGVGKIDGIDENLVIPDKGKSIFDDAVACWKGETMRWWKNQIIDAGNKSGIPIHKPFYEFTREQKLLLWSGNEYFQGLDAFFEMLKEGRYKIQYSVMLSRYSGKSVCNECSGGRLKKEASYIKVGGKTITELVFMSIEDLLGFFKNISLDDHDKVVAERILTEISNRLQYLLDVGLGYLNLDRMSSTLSGGESQRINLATMLGSSLVGSLYILDEPSIGLHPRDTERLIKVLKQLRDIGNTVIVVEHDEEIMRAADLIVDMGPLAGAHGGEVVFQGSFDQLKDAKGSLTADFLMGKETIDMPQRVRKWNNFIQIKGARQNNLKNIDVKIPLGVITAITGVSGSGKSSLVDDILYPALRRQLLEIGSFPGDFGSIEGDLKKIKSVEMIDQNPLGRSMRSNPVTYVKAYDEIRKLFSELPRSKTYGFDPSSFSFNIAGGRCEECKGEGVIRVEMQFMADVELVCDHCKGKRFKDNILEVKYKDKSISDVLDMPIDEAIVFFGQDKARINEKIVEKLGVLDAVGLGYVKLGQPISTLSGGERQRVKLASFLLKESNVDPILFIFDEPTTGLHFYDIKKLLASLNSLVERGHTVVIVEHNMDVVKCADWVIDLGPEGGVEGGNLVFEGTPSELAHTNLGYTSKYLKDAYGV